MTIGARLKGVARSVLARAPVLHRLLRMAILRLRPLPPRRMHVPLDANDLSPDARAAYDALKRRFRSGKR